MRNSCVPTNLNPWLHQLHKLVYMILCATRWNKPAMYGSWNTVLALYQIEMIQHPESAELTLSLTYQPSSTCKAWSEDISMIMLYKICNASAQISAPQLEPQWLELLSVGNHTVTCNITHMSWKSTTHPARELWGHGMIYLLMSSISHSLALWEQLEAGVTLTRTVPLAHLPTAPPPPLHPCSSVSTSPGT